MAGLELKRCDRSLEQTVQQQSQVIEDLQLELADVQRLRGEEAVQEQPAPAQHEVLWEKQRVS